MWDFQTDASRRRRNSTTDDEQESQVGWFLLGLNLVPRHSSLGTLRPLQKMNSTQMLLLLIHRIVHLAVSSRERTNSDRLSPMTAMRTFDHAVQGLSRADATKKWSECQWGRNIASLKDPGNNVGLSRLDILSTYFFRQYSNSLTLLWNFSLAHSHHFICLSKNTTFTRTHTHTHIERKHEMKCIGEEEKNPQQFLFCTFRSRAEKVCSQINILCTWKVATEAWTCLSVCLLSIAKERENEETNERTNEWKRT